ncbi:MAG: tRNA 4-thiouridine(8) synthase ThiI [Spirochaetales bacterium]|uniref:Probable tRNA sulfurtransferase n=1 Tax=Candidatus Thalassospirochaeta sargassi TaxID=3119039 RepID=A0AAJ1MIK0_9SPIO|nr:tRNA 4-thiouridine(8) synthase ThiI [Spirochaetales bacterium]
MKRLYLIKIGEIALKGGNRNFFEKRLKKNIKFALRGIKCTVWGSRGRFFIEAPEESASRVEDVLGRTFGIKGYSKVQRLPKELEQITEEAVRMAKQNISDGRGLRFKIQTRRADKGFPMNSYEISCALGEAVLKEVKGTVVDLKNPDWTINVEMRETAYLYGRVEKGPGGLPVSCAGSGLLLLSGGIDSPVAGWLMAKRGLKLDAIYFHTYPYTSDEARQKVIDLAEILSKYTCGLNLHIVPFTDVQLAIKERGFEKATTLLMRYAMVKIADRIAKENNGLALVTGEALSQVASQTPESIRYTGSGTDLPIFRPLIGMDKEEIIRIAENIDTYRTSILPYEDCCTLFAPEHPITHPDFDRLTAEFSELGIEDMMDKAADETEKIYLNGADK